MRSQFSAPKGCDLRDKCRVFKMVAINDEDMEFLAHLYRTIWVNGGKITVEDKELKETYYFRESTL